MKLPPLFDFVGNPLLAVVVLVLLFLQWRFPLRRQHFGALRRLVRNYVVSIPGFLIVRFAMLPIPLAVAVWAQHRHLGLLNWLGLPGWVAAVAAFVLMDYAYWWWHWANHMVLLFWRFHNVHHTDLDMDVTTAARFHFGEMFFSVGFLSLTLLVLGVAPLTFIVFFIAFEAATCFHHSNWRLPIALERILNLIIVTPVPQAAITIGVAAYRDEKELTVGQLLALPFRKQRSYWQLPGGEHPDRSVQPARKLVE